MYIIYNVILLLKYYLIWMEICSISIYIIKFGFLKIIYVLLILCCFINIFILCYSSNLIGRKVRV